MPALNLSHLTGVSSTAIFITAPAVSAIGPLIAGLNPMSKDATCSAGLR